MTATSSIPENVVTGVLPGALQSCVTHALARAREAQPAWAETPVRERLAVLRRFRQQLVAQARELAATTDRPEAETLSAQIIPLADAVLFLEKNAARALAPRRLGRHGRPAWLSGVEAEVHREPHGVVLIITPGNYPIFLPGSHALQALAAGNAVLLKPSPQGLEAARELARLAASAGLDPRLFAVLPSEVDAARMALQLGPDRVVVTGSADTGRQILAAAAEQLLPCTLELSGSDAVLVRADADLERVVAALLFGLRLNDGATCIAPRRVFAVHGLFARLDEALQRAIARLQPIPFRPGQRERLVPLLQGAIDWGATLYTPGGPATQVPAHGPVVVSRADPSMRLLQEDLFAPVLSLVEVADDDDALRQAARCPWALGASIFTANETEARRLAARVSAGVVTVNDLIVPTADPRLPFGGRGASGYGVTRGLEGLLEMTRLKSVSVRRGNWLPHLDPPREGDAELFSALLQLQHASSVGARLRVLPSLVRLALRRRRIPTSPSDSSPLPTPSSTPTP